MKFRKLSSEELRAHKGVSFTGITTVFLCHDGKGSILLGRRSENARDENGAWDPGGGGVKHGQSIDDTLERELMEEYGVVAVQKEFIGYFDAFRENGAGNKTHWLAMCFAVEVDPKLVEICEPEMIDEIGWFNLNKLPSPMHSQFSVFMKHHEDEVKKAIKR